jgi:hypothetical protein
MCSAHHYSNYRGSTLMEINYRVVCVCIIILYTKPPSTLEYRAHCNATVANLHGLIRDHTCDTFWHVNIFVMDMSKIRHMNLHCIEKDDILHKKNKPCLKGMMYIMMSPNEHHWVCSSRLWKVTATCTNLTAAINCSTVHSTYKRVKATLKLMQIYY